MVLFAGTSAGIYDAALAHDVSGNAIRRFTEATSIGKIHERLLPKVKHMLQTKQCSKHK